MSTSMRKAAISMFLSDNPAATISDLYDFLEKKFSNISRSAHRAFVTKLVEEGHIKHPSQKVYSCPKCNQSVVGLKEAKEVFGLRRMKIKNGEGETKKLVERTQSWCKQCRSRKKK